jgi:hypothetical protein
MNSTRFRVRSREELEKLVNEAEELNNELDIGRFERAHLFEYTPYINLGIIKGLKRSTKGDMNKIVMSDWGTDESISANAHFLLKTCPEMDKTRVYKAFLNENWDRLTATSLPWFIPEASGGWGLPIRDEYKPSKEDLRTATILKSFPNLYKMPKQGKIANWKVWEYAQARYPKDIPSVYKITQTEIQVSRGTGEELTLTDQEGVMGRLCIEALFREKKVKSLFKEEVKQSNRLRNMEKLLRTVRKSKQTEDHRIKTMDLEQLQVWNAEERVLFLTKRPAQRYKEKEENKETDWNKIIDTAISNLQMIELLQKRIEFTQNKLTSAWRKAKLEAHGSEVSAGWNDPVDVVRTGGGPWRVVKHSHDTSPFPGMEIFNLDVSNEDVRNNANELRKLTNLSKTQRTDFSIQNKAKPQHMTAGDRRTHSRPSQEDDGQ